MRPDNQTRSAGAASLEDVDAALEKSLDRFRSVCGQIAGETDDLVTAAIRLGLAGGKRLRARLFYWGWRAAGNDDNDDILDLAIALEVFHLFALVHDDVMDGSALRRGQPSAHHGLTNLHVERLWRGDAAHFGTSAAILLGDALLVWADMIIDESPLLTDKADRFRRAYNDMRLEVMSGQYLDFLAACEDSTSTAKALRVGRLKSGNYTIAHPLRLGAIAGGADIVLVSALGSLGQTLGEAFQIHDDIVGVFGTVGSGKPVGDDLRQGKNTYLVAAALDRVDHADGIRLRGLLGRPAMSEPELQEATELIRRSEAEHFARGEIANRLHHATCLVKELPVDDDIKITVGALFRSALDGSHNYMDGGASVAEQSAPTNPSGMMADR